MQLLAISSQKGGVGKTTVAVNLAYSLARRGWNTLLVDTDPQGSVGLSLSEKARKCQGFYDAVNTGANVLPLILPTRLPELNILTAGQTHSFFGMSNGAMDTLAALRRIVAEIATRPFDLVIFDTPAGLMGSTGDVLRLADSLLIPQQAEPLGIRSIPQMLQAIQFLRNHGSKTGSGRDPDDHGAGRPKRKHRGRPRTACPGASATALPNHHSPGSGISESIGGGRSLGIAAPSASGGSTCF